MRITNELSDEAFLEELGQRIARKRIARNMTQAALAREAGVNRATVARFEMGGAVQTDRAARILRVLRLLGNFQALVPEDGIDPIEMVRMQGRKRRRASGKPPKPARSGPWKWGDEE